MCFYKVFTSNTITICKNEIISTWSEDGFIQYFSFLKTIEDEHRIRVQGVHIDSFGDVRLEIARLSDVLFSEDTYALPTIIYNDAETYEVVLRNLDIVLGYQDFKQDFTNKPQKLESIDIRFSGRVFYTFRPELADAAENNIWW